jgi:hypothetical protein
MAHLFEVSAPITPTVIKMLREAEPPWSGAPWEPAETYMDEWDTPYTSVRQPGASIEDTIAEFWGAEHDHEATAAYACLAVNTMPMLLDEIEKLREERDDCKRKYAALVVKMVE